MSKLRKKAKSIPVTVFTLTHEHLLRRNTEAALRGTEGLPTDQGRSRDAATKPSDQGQGGAILFM